MQDNINVAINDIIDMNAVSKVSFRLHLLEAIKT